MSSELNSKKRSARARQGGSDTTPARELDAVRLLAKAEDLLADLDLANIDMAAAYMSHVVDTLRRHQASASGKLDL